MKHAVVIIPTYNERENIAKVVPLLLQTFRDIESWKMSILVVDDTSPDKTYEVARELSDKHPTVHLLLNKQKAGLGGAYLKGMEYAFSTMKADLIFEFDADLSHDPEKIPVFLEKIDAGADMVLGSRYIAGGGIPADWGVHRKFLSIVGNWVIMAILGTFSVRDWTTGFRAITKKVYQAVAPSLNKEQFFGYTFQIGFLQRALKEGFVIKEVPFVFVDRTIGSSKLGPEYLKNTLLFIMRVRIQELLEKKVVKFALVGGMGAVVQLLTLQLWRGVLPDFQYFFITSFSTAMFLSIELAILSNFILNNFWTFSDRKIAPAKYVRKFIKFNLASGGSIMIQMIVAFIGEHFFGIFSIFTLPVISILIDTGHIYAVLGILLGMSWNFFAYNKFIWNSTKPAA
ncbi:MAG: glycosyltransferase family 2 protein [Patescibacteria group bacterium]